MKALIVIANGIEEMETVITADMLVRADFNVTIASVEDKFVKASRGVKLEADALLNDVMDQAFDIVICPGGLPGAETLQQSKTLKQILLKQHKENKWIAAICASPAYVFASHGLLDRQKATCYPGNENKLPHYVDAPVVTDGNVITSQGPGTTFKFALEIIKQLRSEEIASQVAAQALVV